MNNGPPKLPDPDGDPENIPGPLTEIEENLFRNLLARLREEKPGVFRDICMDAMTHRLPRNTMSLHRRRNENTVIDACVLVTNGIEVTKRVMSSLDPNTVDFLREIDGEPYTGA